ncbi:hypothetical protein ACP70R_032557 [Stipagrostis hirtigluma subsp. patula]
MGDSISTWYMSPLLIFCALVPLAAALLVHILGRKNPETTTAAGKKGRLPPGPPLLVFLAKFLALRPSIFELEPLIRELHARYGPVISLPLFGTHVFVSDRLLAHRILVQGGAAFADRAPLSVVRDPDLLFTTGCRTIASSPYGPFWRLLRRNLANEGLHRGREGIVSPARRWAFDDLVRNLLHSGGDSSAEAGGVVTLRPFVQRSMTQLYAHMCFGARLGEDAVDEIRKLQHHVHVSTTTSFPIFYFFPAITKKLFRRRWAADVAVRRRLEELYLPLIHAARSRSDGDPPCYADSLLALRVPEEGDRPLTDGEMVSLCIEFLSGGVDTTGTLVEFIMAELVNHPDIQAKLREEVRAKPELGDGDIEAMPYLKTVVLEGLRLHPPGHFILPHYIESDMDIGGYMVPRGAEVNFMVAEIGRDETVWTEAQEFRPERFLDGGEGCGVDLWGTKEITMMPFSAGRRMCPGYSMAMRNTKSIVATMVRELEWRPPVDGEKVDMTETLDLIVQMKHPLRARIMPAS